jgi:hypothetical protein
LLSLKQRSELGALKNKKPVVIDTSKNKYIKLMKDTKDRLDKFQIQEEMFT